MVEHPNHARDDGGWSEERDAQGRLDGQHGVQVLQHVGARDPLRLWVLVHVADARAEGVVEHHLGLDVELRGADRDSVAGRVGDRLDDPGAAVGELPGVLVVGRGVPMPLYLAAADADDGGADDEDLDADAVVGDDRGECERGPGGAVPRGADVDRVQRVELRGDGVPARAAGADGLGPAECEFVDEVREPDIQFGEWVGVMMLGIWGAQ
ncbi:hypothetical protein H0H87_003899 [Tephrocybe sp. NHM501043]|nr:hypothetical protein H0H87_003899 [Tephrocybe sp. NHM501043]